LGNKFIVAILLSQLNNGLIFAQISTDEMLTR